MMRATTAYEKQGEMGDLNQKTKPELLDLLARQEKLLANKSFLSRLKDKGARVKSFAEKLRMLIAEREEVERTMELFEKMDLRNEDGVTIGDVTERTGSQKDFVKDSVDVTTARANAQPHTVETSRTSDSGGSVGDSSSGIHHDKKGKFKPNRDLKSTAIPDDLPRPDVTPAPIRGHSSQEGEELSAVVIPPLRNQEAQVVEMAESANLLQEQKKTAEALMAKQAAERLTERLHVKMGDFLPQIREASYRGKVDDGDGESEEFAEYSDSDDQEEGEED